MLIEVAWHRKGGPKDQKSVNRSSFGSHLPENYCGTKRAFLRLSSLESYFNGSTEFTELVNLGNLVAVLPARTPATLNSVQGHPGAD